MSEGTRDTCVELDSGLRLVVREEPGKPLVSSALWYGVGTRHETAEQSGLAHFLEHMMFKGSERFGAGEVDRITQGLGGTNNAFTSHDATVYTFTVPARSWRTVFEIEADRLTTLLLDPAEVESERQVILEEIAMYESDPWDALDQAVVRQLFGEHPYGQPVLGWPEAMRTHTPEDLRRFRNQHYHPGNATLVLCGGIDAAEAAAFAAEAFSPDATATARQRAEVADEPGDPQRLPASEPRRIVRQMGESPRLLWSAVGPAGSAQEHLLDRIVLAVLSLGRSSRLHRRLVEAERSAVWVTADLSEMVGTGTLSFALEVTPGSSPSLAEQQLFEEVVRLAEEPPSDAEVERVRRMLRAEYVFSQERAARQVVSIGAEQMLFTPGHYRRVLERIEAVTADELTDRAERLAALAARRGGVIGWSLSEALVEEVA